MGEEKDIFKIAVSIALIHIMIIVIMAGTDLGVNPTDNAVQSALTDMVGNTGGIGNQISSSGLCLSGTATEEECLANGCVWQNNQCLNAMQQQASSNFNIFDLFQTLLALPLYLGKIVLFLGTIVFYEIILSFKLMPLISDTTLKWLVGVILWSYQMVVLYYSYAFISNWRGIKG